jgi:hypothetical protein
VYVYTCYIHRIYDYQLRTVCPCSYVTVTLNTAGEPTDSHLGCFHNHPWIDRNLTDVDISFLERTVCKKDSTCTQTSLHIHFHIQYINI